MQLDSIVSPALLQEMIEGGFIRRNQHPTDPIALLNYTEQATFTKTWNQATLASRGLIYDLQDNRVLARPFDKFFNLGEVEMVANALDGPVEVTDKMDGSLGIGYRYGNHWRVATRGSFASDQAIWATKWLNETYPNFSGVFNLTPLWEIVYPENRIVLDYGDYEGLVLLGWRDIKTGTLYGPEAFPEDWRGHRTEVMSAYSLQEALKLPPRENAEGVVVRWTKSGFQVKIKQEDYVKAHAVVTGMTNRAVWEILRDGESLPEKAAFMPDEFYEWLTITADQLQRDQFTVKIRAGLKFMEIQEQMEKNGEAGWGHIGERTYDRKTFAGYAKQHEGYTAALFMKYDGNEEKLDDWAWMQVRPAEIKRPWTKEA